MKAHTFSSSLDRGGELVYPEFRFQYECSRCQLVVFSPSPVNPLEPGGRYYLSYIQTTRIEPLHSMPSESGEAYLDCDLWFIKQVLDT